MSQSPTESSGSHRRQKTSATIVTLCVLLALTASLRAPAPAAERQAPVVFAGSGTSLGVVRALAESFGRHHPDVAIEVPPSIGSSGAVRAVAEGGIPVGLLARPLRDSEKGLGLTVVPYAKTAVVLAVHPSVAEDEISGDDLVRIYQGQKTRWRDGRDIVVLTREPGDNHLEAIEQQVPRFKEAYAASYRARRWTVVFTDQDMHRLLEQMPSAIGLGALGSIPAEHRTLKPLRFNGVAPTPENVAAGRYTLTVTNAFIFRDTGRLPAGARAFIDFVRSREADKIIRATGLIPIS